MTRRPPDPDSPAFERWALEGREPVVGLSETTRDKILAGRPLYAWPHDCDECQYVESGRVTMSPGKSYRVDWYLCAGMGGGSLLGRFGRAAPDYWSSDTSIIRAATPVRPVGGFMGAAQDILARIDES